MVRCDPRSWRFAGVTGLLILPRQESKRLMNPFQAEPVAAGQGLIAKVSRSTSKRPA
jgi:hypothetical protein